ncbi:hypothetical protein ABH935_005711 [Catenulispora sp. GAS73]
MLRALIAGLPRVNCWTLAEHAGYATPGAFQNLLSRARWDHDGVRDDLREHVAERLGTREAVLVLDETGDVKKGTETVGSSGSTPAPPAGSRTLRSRSTQTGPRRAGRRSSTVSCMSPERGPRLRERCAAAGLPEQLEFATKPALALGIVTRTVAAGIRPSWVAGDEVYGNDPDLRAGLEGVGIGYVLAVPRSLRLRIGPASIRADVLAAALPEAFQSGKALAGRDEHQVRRYTSWYRWTVLAMLAHAFLTITTAQQPGPQTASSLIPFTRNEIRHLLATLTFTIPHRPDHRWSWSACRRRHQLGAKHCHCQRRESCWT